MANINHSFAYVIAQFFAFILPFSDGNGNCIFICQVGLSAISRGQPKNDAQNKAANCLECFSEREDLSPSGYVKTDTLKLYTGKLHNSTDHQQRHEKWKVLHRKSSFSCDTIFMVHQCDGTKKNLSTASRDIEVVTIPRAPRRRQKKNFSFRFLS